MKITENYASKGKLLFKHCKSFLQCDAAAVPILNQIITNVTGENRRLSKMTPRPKLLFTHCKTFFQCDAASVPIFESDFDECGVIK